MNSGYRKIRAGDPNWDELSDDLTPQLGGNLDVNGQSIVSTSGGDIAITPDTTGSVILDGLSWPQADGTNGYVLTTDGAGNLSWAPDAGGGMSDVVDDTTPQLGGNLDVNGFQIVSVSNGNIQITPNGTGRVFLDGIKHPDADGTTGYVLATNGSAELTWVSKLTDIVDDTTPQLGGSLDVNGFEINGAIDIHSTGDIIMELGDAAGVNEISIRDSAGVEVAFINSDGDIDGTDLTLDGNITLGGTVDGRDVATDGTKLDGIESGATADQSDAEIKTAYENNSDTNAFTDAEKTKLAGIETGATADQTGAEIKTAYEAEANTNAFTDSEKTKLAGIETGADVTDATNVDAAGAVMNSDTSTASMSFVVDEDTMSSDSATKVPTQQSVKAYVDSAVSGASQDLVLISTATASSSASISFTGLSSTYYEYIVVYDNIQPATDGADLLVRTSANNGSSYDSGSSDYKWGHSDVEMKTTSPTSIKYGSNASSAITLHGDLGSASNEVTSGVLRIINPSRAIYTHILFNGIRGHFTINPLYDSGGGMRLSAAAVDAIQFIFDSGNISTGTFKLYGVVA